MILELIYPDFINDSAAKTVIEQISYNILSFMTRKDMFNMAYQILLRFENSLDTFLRSRVNIFFFFNKQIVFFIIFLGI